MAELIVALDFPGPDEATEFAGAVSDEIHWCKVGLELFTAAGPRMVCDLKEMGYKVFLDLKFFDIPNTVKGAVRSAARLGADLVDIHLMGGMEMALAALEGRDQGTAPGRQGPLVFGITVLTSMGPDNLPGVADLGAEVVRLASLGKKWGLDGAVCSGHEAEGVRKACGPGFLCLTPGIRLSYSQDDQQRVMTPGKAVSAGSDFLVAGRPITASDDPKARIRDFYRDMTGQ